MEKPQGIGQYIASCPVEHQQKLHQLRHAVKEIVSQTQEKISYGMPVFVFHVTLVYFMLRKNPIGFYPLPSGIEMFLQKTPQYKTGKESIQFPLNEDILFDLIQNCGKF